MITDWKRIASDYEHCGPVSAAEFAGMVQRTADVSRFTDDEIGSLVQALSTVGSPQNERQSLHLTGLIARLAQRQRSLVRQPGVMDFTSTSRAAARSLYPLLAGLDRARGYLLAWLASGSGPEELDEFCHWMILDPPTDPTAIGLAFAPLFQAPGNSAAAVFPRLLEALGHRRVAPLVLDLANFLTRQRRVTSHPAEPRREELLALLSGLTGHLTQLETNVPEGSASPQEIAEQVGDSVALVVAICDALSLLQEHRAIARLEQVLELRHRRVQTEAAAALARFGEDSGIEALCRLATEPVARLRVLAYSEELGIADRIGAEFRSPVAVAEAELASWLAESTQMGIAPSRLELVDSRTQYWPGYEEPRNCYLFRFRYELGRMTYENLGIAGPLPHAFAADLRDLEIEDVYAAFAGWQAEHEEIFEREWTELPAPIQRDAASLTESLVAAGYEQIQPLRLGSFFGDRALIAQARRADQVGTAVVDDRDIAWFPQRAGPRPLGPDDAYSIYKGRKLLAAFN